MKTQKISAIKTVTTAMVVCTLLAIAACSNKKENSTKEKKISSVSQKDQKPPAIDIHTAALLGDTDAIYQHINAGSDLNIKEPAGGSTPLITAIVFGKNEVAITLIEAGAELNCKNNDGSTPLYCAAFFCHIEIVKALLDKGADKNIRNNFGVTAFESVSGPFENVKGIYDIFSKELGPMGLKLDYKQLELTRPMIAELLQ